MNDSLSNYLRSYRQKAGLTQDEVAFLMGGTHGSTITRHEEYLRVPTLDTALGYATIYGDDLRTLFAGRFERRQRLVRRRADALLGQLPVRRGAQVGPFLQALLDDPASHLVPCEQDGC